LKSTDRRNWKKCQK